MEMSVTSERTGAPALAWPWSAWADAVAGLSGRFAPHELHQPINPGWILAQSVTVNERNSSAPETERKIVAEESYGRQIGRISDALAVLLRERPERTPEAKEILAFKAMCARIGEIKHEAAVRRAERFLEDLEQLKREDPAEYGRLAAMLRRLE
jgi:hypothetical protein